MADSLDRIFTSAPLNQTAARVTSKGDHYEPTVNYAGHAHFEAPPPTIPVPPNSLHSCQDIIARKFGRMTVIGLAADQNPKKNARWVVRCACGCYEHRKAKSIRNPLNADDCCQNCQHLTKVRKRYDRLGPKPLDAFRQPTHTSGER